MGARVVGARRARLQGIGALVPLLPCPHCSNKFKLIILDECDAMTKDAMFALRRGARRASSPAPRGDLRSARCALHAQAPGLRAPATAHKRTRTVWAGQGGPGCGCAPWRPAPGGDGDDAAA